MNLFDVRDQILETFKNLWERIVQSTVFNNIRERYEVLPAATQRLILYIAGGATVLFLIYLPMSFFVSASGRVAEFEETRTLLRELLKTTGLEDLSRLAPSISAEQIRTQVDALLAESQLTPEQISSMEPFEGDRNSSVVPRGVKNINQQGLVVKLKKLNVNQIQDIGYRLQTMQPQEVKLMGLEVARTPGEKFPYFDVEFKLVNYSVTPLVQEPSEPEPKKPGRPALKKPGG